MFPRKGQRLLAVLVLAAVGLGGLLLMTGSASATSPTTIELQLERAVWKLKERMIVSGRLTAGDRALGGAPVQLGVDGDPGETPYRTTTATDGSYRLEFPVEDWWGFGGHSLTAHYPGGEGYTESSFTTIFQVAPDQVAPVVLTVDPPPSPVAPGEEVRLTGALRNDRQEPAGGHSVIAVIDAAREDRAFAKVDDDGVWALEFVVPSTPGQWSERFPEYRVAVVFEGDWWLAPTQVDVPLTLLFPPLEPSPTPLPTPSPSRAPSPTPSATPTPTLLAPVSASAPPPGPLPAWLPAWVASPVFLLATGAFLAMLVGATLIAHGRRGA